MPLQCLIQKWSFEFALFQMFCTVPVNENLHRRRNWSDCEMHFEVLLEATRHDADLGSLQNSSENLSLQSKAEWSCHQFCQTGLSYLISTGSVVADESYYIYIYIIYEVTLSRRSPNSEDFSFISVGDTQLWAYVSNLQSKFSKFLGIGLFMSHTSFAFQVLMFVQGTSCRAFIKPAPKSTLPSKSYTQGSFLERKNHRRGWRAIKTLSKISKWHWDVEEKMKFVCALWNACDCVRWGFGGVCVATDHR